MRRSPFGILGVAGVALGCAGMASMLPGVAVGALGALGITGSSALARTLSPVAQPLFIVSAALVLISAMRCSRLVVSLGGTGVVLLYLSMFQRYRRRRWRRRLDVDDRDATTPPRRIDAARKRSDFLARAGPARQRCGPSSVAPAPTAVPAVASHAPTRHRRSLTLRVAADLRPRGQTADRYLDLRRPGQARARREMCSAIAGAWSSWRKCLAGTVRICSRPAARRASSP